MAIVNTDCRTVYTVWDRIVTARLVNLKSIFILAFCLCINTCRRISGWSCLRKMPSDHLFISCHSDVDS